jgi:hypothetical protein
MKRESSVVLPSAEAHLVASGGYCMCRCDVLTDVCVVGYEKSLRGLRAVLARCRDMSSSREPDDQMVVALRAVFAWCGDMPKRGEPELLTA